jgi:hypothetical protein
VASATECDGIRVVARVASAIATDATAVVVASDARDRRRRRRIPPGVAVVDRRRWREEVIGSKHDTMGGETGRGLWDSF